MKITPTGKQILSCILFPFLYLLITGILPAAAYPTAIKYLGIEDGLSNNSVRCVFKDQNGFMWFGTYDGLNRYDGYEFKVFRNKLNDSNSLPHNYIYAISEDQQHNLWVGTGQGIGIYNTLTAKWKPAYFYPYQVNSTQKLTANITAIATDATGNVLIGTNGRGLIVKQNSVDTALQIPIITGTKKTINSNIQALHIDAKKQVWLFIEDVGLCRYDHAAKQIRLVNNVVLSATSLETDDADNIWIGTTGGLYKCSTTNNLIIKTYNEQSGKLSSANIASLLFDEQHNLWIGTEGGGINILNTTNETIDYLLPGQEKNRFPVSRS